MDRSHPRRLEFALTRGNNNFDLLRLVAALMVIVGHAHALCPRPNSPDLVLRWVHFDYSGSLAVKFFFFLSGLLVANSFIEKPSAWQFAASRFFRIFPGLLVCLLLTACVIGAACTTLPLAEYLRHAETWSFIRRNALLLDIQWRLPGVFTASRFGVNGSLWTLPFEILCYLYLLVIGSVGLLRVRWLATGILVAVIAVAFLSPEWMPYFGPNTDARLLPACFAMGALCALHKTRIELDWQAACALWLLFVLSNDPGSRRFAFYVALFYSSLIVASLEVVASRLRLPFDASYGVYVYGFPVQQALYAAFPHMRVTVNQGVAGAVACGLGVASWYLVEKPAMRWGRTLVRSLSEGFSGPASEPGKPEAFSPGASPQ